jgi:predicted regulator of Ras-like GTPase activity (Roadblock/LC7/MglB family)
VAKSKLLLAVLINRDGRILTHQGGLEHIDIVSLAALVAGNTASTLAIANLMGETEFSAMYHQGKEKNIYIDAIDENTFLSVVFNDQTNIDRVKVFIRQFERQLKEALHAVYDKDEDQIDLDLDMGSSSFPNLSAEAPPHYQQSGFSPPYGPSVQTGDRGRTATGHQPRPLTAGGNPQPYPPPPTK